MSDPKLLSREEILGAPDREHKDVEVEGWEGSVRLIVMDGVSRDIFDSACAKSTKTNGAGTEVQDISGLKALLLSMTIVDENFDRIFTKEDVGAINAKNGGIIQELFKESSALNKIGEEEVKSETKNS